MTKRDRIVIVCAVLLAVFVITGVVFQGITNAVWKQASSLLVTVGFILIGLFSVFVVLFLRIRKSAYEKRLQPDYFAVYQGIQDALNASALPKADRRDALSDILELLLSAQNSAKPIDSVIPNPAAFTQSVLQSYASNARRCFFNLINGCFACLAFVVLTQTLLWLESPRQSFFLAQIDVSMLFFFAVISFIVLPLVRLFSAKQSLWAYALPLLSGILLIGILEALRLFFSGSSFINALLDHSIQMIPSIAVLGVYLLAILLLVLVKWMIRCVPLRK